MPAQDRFHTTDGVHAKTHVHLGTGAILHEFKIGDMVAAGPWVCQVPGKCRQALLVSYPSLTATRGARVILTDVGLGLTVWITNGTIWRPETPIICTGTPEGVVVAPVGSLAVRTDGGAGTTLYVKQSGTGNTGWVAK